MNKTNKIISIAVFSLLVTVGVFFIYKSDYKSNPAALSLTDYKNNITNLSEAVSENEKVALSDQPANQDPKNSAIDSPIKDYKNIDINTIVKDEKVLSEIIDKIGIKEAMAALIEQSGGGSQYDCHQQAHTIGRIGYKIEKEKAFGSCDASCHSGCYHGAMESFLIENGTTNLAEKITMICKQFETSFGNFECLHGVGHGVLAYLDYDVPSAIKECQKLSDGWGQNACYGGVFMENILTGQGLGAITKVDHTTEWVNKTDPYFPCNKIDKSYDVQYQCYQMQTSWMLTISGYNFDVVAKECLDVPGNMQPVCFRSLGRDAAGNTLRDPVKILQLCSVVPEIKNYYDECIIGALNVIVDFWGPALRNQASQLCKITKEPHKKTCYQTLAERLPGLFNNKTEEEKICNTFEASYQDLCN